ncbi:spermatogenesis- and oogenesis-specific basic helix-loop-helix-containing protein 2 isoform X2 [Rhinatrema bivittatum]|nr:spermatogenesis- and oogenesis-specific basic helix-loop-helix-containing protein 2 isoform X2 [Rhinatrema bivittatum]
MFLNEHTFNIVFLQMSSTPTASELEAVKTIRFNKKKNQNLLFSSIIPENFQDCVSGHRADIIIYEPLTPEKLKIVVDCWKSTSLSPDKNGNLTIGERCEVPLQLNTRKRRTCDCTDMNISKSSGSLREKTTSWSTSSACNSTKNKIFLHSNKEKMRRERIKKCCDQLRVLLHCIFGRKTDTASVLEATVDYMRSIHDKVPPAVTAQITKTLQSNKRFCKRPQMQRSISPQSCVMTQRNNSQIKSLSPWKKQRLRTNKYINVLSSCHSDNSPCKETWTAESDVTKYFNGGSLAAVSEKVASHSIKNLPVKSPVSLSFNSASATQPVYQYPEAVPCLEVAAISTKKCSMVSLPSMPAISIFPSYCHHPPSAQTCTILDRDTTDDTNLSYLQQDRLCATAANAAWLDCQSLQFMKGMPASLPAGSGVRTDIKESHHILLFWSGSHLSGEWSICQGIAESREIYQTSASQFQSLDIPDPRSLRKFQYK